MAKATAEVVGMLRRVPLFNGMPADALQMLAEAFHERRLRKNVLVCRQGEPGESMFLVQSGSVKVGMRDNQGAEVTVALLGPGQFFGDMALVEGHPRSADVLTTKDSVLLELLRGEFLNVLTRNRRALDRLLVWLNNRVRQGSLAGQQAPTRAAACQCGHSHAAHQMARAPACSFCACPGYTG